MTPALLAGLSGALLLAFTVEATLGFGATLLAVALGSLLVPLDAWLPVVVVLNLPLSGYVLARDGGAVAWRLLGRVLPLMALGLPAGLLLLELVPPELVTRLLGLVVVGLATLQLLRAPAEQAAPPARWAGGALLLAGGVVHGMCGSGGPLAVYVTSRELPDKRAFRATLAALWLTLNLTLLAVFLVRGRLGGDGLAPYAVLALPAAAGLLLGDWAHRRVPAAPFRRAVLGLLLGVGVLLLVRA